MKCTKMQVKNVSSIPTPNDPPRCRGNKTRGHGTWDSDRPPVLGVIGRESGQIQLEVKRRC